MRLMKWPFVFIWALILISSQALALSCLDVRLITSNLIEIHYSYDKITPEISKRVLSQVLKAFDSQKNYFLESDVKKFEVEYETQIGEKLKATDCRFIDNIANVYNQRFKERQAPIQKAIAMKHDYKIDEYLVFDPKELPWASSSNELDERWRKRVKFQAMQLKDTMNEAAVKEKLKKRYALAEKNQRETKLNDIYTLFINSFALSLDPHTEYFPPVSLEEFRIQTRLSLEGIGAVLRSEDGFTKIQSLVPGGAAAKTGKVNVGDTIIAVAQGAEAPVEVIDMDLKDVVKLVRGKRGTEVRLSLMRESQGGKEKLVVAIIREKVDLEDRAAKSWVYEVKPKDGRPLKVGVLSLPSFYMDFQGRSSGSNDFKSSSRDMLNELDSLSKANIDALVVDLRNNGGGSLEESIKIAGMFIEKGPIVQIKDQSPGAKVHEDTDKNIYYKGPLVVMTNLQSASASEIFAGAIKDYGRGIIVGDPHTFGKGTVQNLTDLDPRMGAIKVTISKFFRPGGSSTQLKGVDSDIVLPSIMTALDIGEKNYDYALPWDKVDRTNFAPVNQVEANIKSLADASEARVKANEKFKKVKEQYEEYAANTKKRTQVSLKEDKSKDNKNLEDENEERLNLNFKDKPDIFQDFYLNEGIQIAADYARLTQKQPLVSFELPDFESAKTKSLADNQKKSSVNQTQKEADPKKTRAN